MAATLKKDTDSEVNVTYQDQEKINRFARFNARLQDLKEELEAKKKELQNLEDAGDELMLAEDEDALIPYQIGEVFVLHSIEETNTMLEEAKNGIQDDIKAIETKAEEHKQILSDLKVQLYAKFGTNINLEADED